jgi:cell wall-associated NlpC family hydrolase
VDYARTFLGTDYLYAGRDPKKGFDCSGFTYFVMDKFGISLSPSSRAQEGQGRKISVSRVQPGDLIFYRRSAASAVFHVSLVVANEADGIYVIHSTSRGVVVDNITTSSYWAPKISSARDVVSGKF